MKFHCVTATRDCVLAAVFVHHCLRVLISTFSKAEADEEINPKCEHIFESKLLLNIYSNEQIFLKIIGVLH